tara:strand:+ start:3078 stop:3206 length:129 start_codon:yes stop_codon:yes gene_type:complete
MPEKKEKINVLRVIGEKLICIATKKVKEIRYKKKLNYIRDHK